MRVKDIGEQKTYVQSDQRVVSHKNLIAIGVENRSYGV